MAKLVLDITTSLDGFVAGPRQTVEQPLGEGGERLHQWIFGLASWRELHGEPGGVTSADDDLVRESNETTGAVIMGRRMFSGGAGAWEDDPVADGWWGDDPPFHVPVFVLTHHTRPDLPKDGGTSFTFVTDGIDAALAQARAAAGAKNIKLAGGASIAQQYLAIGLLDELDVHVTPVLLGDGVRLFGDLAAPAELELTRVIDSPAVTHLRYRVVK